MWGNESEDRLKELQNEIGQLNEQIEELKRQLIESEKACEIKDEEIRRLHGVIREMEK